MNNKVKFKGPMKHFMRWPLYLSVLVVLLDLLVFIVSVKAGILVSVGTVIYIFIADTIMLNYCKKYQVPVIMDSDAHFDLLIGEFDLARELLTKLDFPEELVLNHSVDAVKKYVNRKF